MIYNRTQVHTIRPMIARRLAGDRRLSELVNVGPFTARRLESVGLRSAGDLEALGAIETYRRLAAAWPEDTTVFTYALQGALLDLRWDALPDAVKAELWAAAGEGSAATQQKG